MMEPVTLQTLDAFYPELQRRQARLTRFWAGASIGRPPLCIMPPLTPRGMVDADAQRDTLVRYCAAILTLPGDAIPVFWPDLGTVALPSVFGGVIRREAGSSLNWIDPVLPSWEAVDALQPPTALSALVRDEFDRCRRWRDLTGGRWPIAMPDMQGPVNIATMLMDPSQFLIGLYEQPERARRLLRMCADLILQVLAAYDTEFGSTLSPQTWPPIWFPKALGFTLTQDSIPTLTPDLYAAFELPLVRELAERRGGVFVHCCGLLEPMLDQVARIPKLRGLDHFHSESNAEAIFAKLGTGIVLTSQLSPRGAERFPAQDHYLRHLHARVPPDARLWHIFYAADPQNVARCLEVLGLTEMQADFLAAAC